MKESRVITILEATDIPQDKWITLQETYAKLGSTSKMRPSQSFLVQNKDNPKLWRIISVWESMEVIQKMRASGETPTGILIFRKAGVEPSLSIFEVKESL